MYFGFGEHHVLAVGNEGADLLNLLVAGKRNALAGQQIPDLAVELDVIRQLKRLCIFTPGIVPDYLDAQAVDGAEFQTAGQLIPEALCKAAAHVSRGGYRVGHGENLLRGNIMAEDQKAQPGHQYRGLAAPRHSQQKHGALRLLDGGLLLGVELNLMFFPKLLVGHGQGSLS